MNATIDPILLEQDDDDQQSKIAQFVFVVVLSFMDCFCLFGAQATIVRCMPENSTSRQNNEAGGASDPEQDEKTKQTRLTLIEKHLLVKPWHASDPEQPMLPPTLAEMGDIETVANTPSPSFDEEEDASDGLALPMGGSIQLTLDEKEIPSSVTDDVGEDDSILDDRLSCSICLNPFEEGESVCESNNSSCPHKYHLVCAQMWLVKHEECPMCRQTYVIPDSGSDEDEVQEDSSS